MEFGFFERRIGRFLSSMPKAHRFFKRVYQTLNYLAFRKKGFLYKIHPRSSLCSIQSLLNTSNNNNYNNKAALFFGYYDKSPWCKDLSLFLFHSCLMKNRGDLELRIIDLVSRKNRSFGLTKTWNYQQGAMLQWLNWFDFKVVAYNSLIKDSIGSLFVKLNKDFSIEKIAESNWPIQSIHPSEEKFISLNYSRLALFRPEYGYKILTKKTRFFENDEKDGLWQINWPNDIDWFLSLDFLKKINPQANMLCAHHKVNHAIYSPNGKRVIFMHRWLAKKGKFSRLYSVDSDGSNLNLLLDNEMVSHYSWRNDEEIIVWARTFDGTDNYLLLNTISGKIEILGAGIFDVFGDGHPSFSKCGRFILTDTYPDRQRIRKLLLFDLETKKVALLGEFLEPLGFDNQLRCDLHPRFSPDDSMISFDSAFSGSRETYIMKLNEGLENFFC